MSICCYIVSFNLIRLVVCEKMSKTDFQVCGCGAHLGFPIHMILAHLVRTLSCSTSFGSKSTKGLGTDIEIDFQDVSCGGHFGFSINSDLAILCLLGPMTLLIKFQLNWIIVFRGDVKNMNSQHFSHINV